MNLEKQLEALLFFKGEPVKISELSKLTGKKDGEVRDALGGLGDNLEERGIKLIIKDEEALLVTAPDVSELIEAARKEEVSRDIGKAGLETLSIILYKGPLARSEIDFIRGVNSTFILRNLLIRGLVERISNPKDQRGFLYRPSFELLSFLGITNTNELPNFEKVKDDLESFLGDHMKDNGNRDESATAK